MLLYIAEVDVDGQVADLQQWLQIFFYVLPSGIVVLLHLLFSLEG